MPIHEFGKQEYVIAELPETPWAYSYSAKGLEEELNRLLTSQRIQAIFVSLDGYLEALHYVQNCIDLSYMGGPALIVMENMVLELAIHAEGMIEYRLFPSRDLTIRRVYDYPPDDMLTGDYFYDISKHDITFDYIGRRIRDISVKGTDTWGFEHPSFDEAIAEAAARKNDLPTEICFRTDTCVIRFVGSDIEYYLVFFETPERHAHKMKGEGKA